MSKGLHATKTGEIVFVAPLGGNHYRLDYSDGRVTFIWPTRTAGSTAEILRQPGPGEYFLMYQMQYQPIKVDIISTIGA